MTRFLPTTLCRCAEIQRHLAAWVIWEWRRPGPYNHHRHHHQISARCDATVALETTTNTQFKNSC